MATIAEKYQYVMEEIADPRVKDWFFMSSPFPMIGLLLAYVYIVYNAAPRFMKNRQPYNLKNIIAVYNIFQVFANATLFYFTLTSGWLTTYSWGCQPVDYSLSPEAMRMARTTWWVTALKCFDLIETVFFVLRKKQNQVSFLHVYHHISTIALCWIGTKYIPGGMASFPVLPNTLIHVLMYTYYLLALGGPKIQRRIVKWKKTLTIMQMVQFCVIIGHAMIALAPSCKVPKFMAFFYIPNVGLVFYLFYDFYKKAYSTKAKTT